MVQQLLAKASRGCLLPSARASFAPRSGIGHARGRPPTLRRGPMGGARCPRPGDPSMASSPLRHTPYASLLPRSLLPHGQDHADLRMCLQGSQRAGRHPALTLELRPWEQAWRSGVWEATHWLVGWESPPAGKRWLGGHFAVAMATSSILEAKKIRRNNHLLIQACKLGYNLKKADMQVTTPHMLAWL